jgi:hypothetical protein
MILEISTIGWVVVILFGVFIIGMNLSLVQYWKRKGRKPGNIATIQRIVRRARNPWEEEEQTLQDLSRKVEPFKNKKMDERSREAEQEPPDFS